MDPSLEKAFAKAESASNPHTRKMLQAFRDMCKDREEVTDFSLLAHVGAAVVLTLKEGRRLDVEALLEHLGNADLLRSINPSLTEADCPPAAALLQSLAPGERRP